MSQLKQSNAGTLDPTFSGTGVKYFPVPEVYGMPDAVLTLADNKSLVAMGSAVYRGPIVVARLNEDGTLDRTFGPAQHGLVEVSIEDTHVDIFGLTLLVDGGWLIVGQYTSDSISGLLVVRQFPDGRLDTSLNGDGKLFIPYDSFGNSQYTGVKLDVALRNGEKSSEGNSRVSGNSGISVVAQSDGKIVLVSTVSDDLKQRGIVLRRNSDGTADLSFAETGSKLIELPGIEHEWNSTGGVAVQADGRILVSGFYIKQDDSKDGYVACFNPQGEVDREFNGGRAVSIANAGDIRAIAVRESDGRIVAVGNALRGTVMNGLIVVLNKSGSYNLPFNKGQPLYSELMPQGHDWSHCVSNADGSIVVTGTTGKGFVTEDMVVVTARYLSDGTLDMSFNRGKGFTVFDGEEGLESAADMSKMADGRIIVCGRLWADAEPWPYISGGWLLRYLA